MLGVTDATQIEGADVVDESGDKIGSVSDIYLDDETNQPEFALVTSGLFGTKHHFVPLRDAELSGDQLRVPYGKDQVKNAPSIDADGQLSQEEEQDLYSYYGLPYSEARSDTGLPQGGAGDVVTAAGTTGGRGEVWDSDAVGRDTSGPTTDDAMTRSEEELTVGTREQEAGRVRLRKHVTTENVSETVPVRHEEARVRREPITDANVDDALSGPEISSEEHEVSLTQEEPVVEKRVVPKERVRLEKETTTGEEQVSSEVRKEEIEVEGDARTTDDR
jgi:uncharacterized protein (TIGR02271 family)